MEEGKQEWRALLAEFYADFHREMEEAETALEGGRLKSPDEETDEICEVCGRNMVIKSGRFGRFLACPGFPDCRFTKAIVEHMPGRCPKCGAGMLKRKSKRGFAYYACETGMDCGFMSWDVPTEEDCPSCGKTLFKKGGKGRMKPFCINEECPNFLSEDQRGYRRRGKTENNDPETAVVEEIPAEEEKKPASRKTAAKKTAKASEKKTAAKKTTEKKTTKKTAKKAAKEAEEA